MGFGVFEQRQSENPRKSKMRTLLKVSGIWENDSLIEEKVMDKSLHKVEVPPGRLGIIIDTTPA